MVSRELWVRGISDELLRLRTERRIGQEALSVLSGVCRSHWAKRCKISRKMLRCPHSSSCVRPRLPSVGAFFEEFRPGPVRNFREPSSEQFMKLSLLFWKLWRPFLEFRFRRFRVSEVASRILVRGVEAAELAALTDFPKELLTNRSFHHF